VHNDNVSVQYGIKPLNAVKAWCAPAPGGGEAGSGAFPFHTGLVVMTCCASTTCPGAMHLYFSSGSTCHASADYFSAGAAQQDSCVWWCHEQHLSQQAWWPGGRACREDGNCYFRITRHHMPLPYIPSMFFSTWMAPFWSQFTTSLFFDQPDRLSQAGNDYVFCPDTRGLHQFVLSSINAVS
jgi:hypothetical protein